jgi:hypothetical protein
VARFDGVMWRAGLQALDLMANGASLTLTSYSHEVGWPATTSLRHVFDF